MSRRPRHALLGLLAALAALTASPGGQALAQPSASDGPSAEAAESPQAGAPVPDPGEAAAPAGAAPTLGQSEGAGEAGQRTMVGQTTEGVSVFRQRLETILRRSRASLARVEERLSEKSPDGEARYFLRVAGGALLLILLGRALVQAWVVFAARPLMSVVRRASPPIGVSGRLPVLAVRMALAIPAVVILLAVVVSLGMALAPDHQPTQATASVILAAYVLFVLVDTAWRIVISPDLAGYRIPRLTDMEARRLHGWTRAASLAAILSHGCVVWMREMGLGEEFARQTAMLLGLVTLGISTALVWRNRAAVSRALTGGRSGAEATWLAALAARIWPVLATAGLLAAWLVEAFRLVMGREIAPPMLAGAFAALMLGLLVQAVGLAAIERACARRGKGQTDADTGPPQAASRQAPSRSDAPAEATAPLAPTGAEPPAEPTREASPSPGEGEGAGGTRGGMRSFEDLARRILSVCALGVAGYLLVLTQGGGAVFGEGSLFDRSRGILVILLLGYAAFHAVRIALDRRIADEGVDDIAAEPGDEGGGASAVSRLGTLLPLFRSAILTTIGVSVALAAATELGVNVAPLFAGAGIVGIAIGFGAQTLVRDILSGMFFLLDDAFRKGEYIDVGAVKGTVEKISLRSFQLRHHLGALHTIPFGEITHLTNFSRDWVMMKLPLRLTYDTDVEKVRKLIKKLGERLLEHPTEGPKFMQPLKSQGVYMMEDSAMIIRIKYMTRPGDQWTTRKLVYKEVRELFEREGIRFAHREVTVRISDLPEDRSLTPEETRAVGAAARRATEEDDAVAG